jgi:hypothetical protein
LPPSTYTITASSGTGGSITPSGSVTVTEGDSQSFTITPNSGYQIADVTVDGTSQGAVASYTFSNVTADHTIAASFTLLPDIDVDPATVSYGNVNIGAETEKSVTVTNNGNNDLIIGSITTPSLPFSIITDNCSDQTLAQSESCTIIIRFSPVSLDTLNGIFDIPSNDPDNNPVTVALTGIGTENGTPDITILPETSLTFANITVGATADQTLTIKNEGTSDLEIYNINPPLDPFSIVSGNDTCSQTVLTPDQSCTFDIRYAPSEPGTFTANLDIQSNDPDEISSTVGLYGSATSLMNDPPTQPVIMSPENGSTGVPTTTTLTWSKCTDPDGDMVTYKLFVGTDPSFTNADPIIIAAQENNTGYAFVFAYQSGILALFGIIITGSVQTRRKNLKLILVLLMLVGSLLLVSCGSSNNVGDMSYLENTGNQFTVENLQRETTYYWKVVAEDENGGITESDTFSFITQL